MVDDLSSETHPPLPDPPPVKSLQKEIVDAWRSAGSPNFTIQDKVLPQNKIKELSPENKQRYLAFLFGTLCLQLSSDRYIVKDDEVVGFKKSGVGKLTPQQEADIRIITDNTNPEELAEIIFKYPPAALINTKTAKQILPTFTIIPSEVEPELLTAKPDVPETLEIPEDKRQDYNDVRYSFDQAQAYIQLPTIYDGLSDHNDRRIWLSMVQNTLNHIDSAEQSNNSYQQTFTDKHRKNKLNKTAITKVVTGVENLYQNPNIFTDANDYDQLDNLNHQAVNIREKTNQHGKSWASIECTKLSEATIGLLKRRPQKPQWTGY